MISHPIVAADSSELQITESGQQTSLTAENKLSETDLARAHTLNLSEMEWHRYQQLIQVIRGSVSPKTISSIEVLGIHARDAGERQRYAEVWARAMREDVERILAFQRAYDAAGKRFYPNEPLIDISRLPGRSEETNTLQSDRLLFFTRPECLACDLLIGKLLQRTNDVSGIDIYLVGLAVGDDAAMREWASIHQIKPECCAADGSRLIMRWVLWKE